MPALRVRAEGPDEGEVRRPRGDTNAGDAYYMAPGHSLIMEAETEMVEFSPKDEYHKTMEVAERNFAAMQADH